MVDLNAHDIDDAMKMLPSYRHMLEVTLVVVNRRRVAIVLDRQSRRGLVMPLAHIEQGIPPGLKDGLHQWLSNPVLPYYVMNMGGSWLRRDPP